MKKILLQAASILVLGGIIGLVVNMALVRRFLGGEFRETFLASDRYPGIRLISLMETEDLLVERRSLFLDARPERLYRDGHILGALSLPATAARKKIPESVLAFDRESTVVIYCEGGDCQSSLAVAKILHDSGFRDLRVFTGGWAEWEQAGLPMEWKDG